MLEKLEEEARIPAFVVVVVEEEVGEEEEEVLGDFWVFGIE
jgi:hypothetical protein